MEQKHNYIYITSSSFVPLIYDYSLPFLIYSIYLSSYGIEYMLILNHEVPFHTKKYIWGNKLVEKKTQNGIWWFMLSKCKVSNK